jgi:hypothetical protein
MKLYWIASPPVFMEVDGLIDHLPDNANAVWAAKTSAAGGSTLRGSA